MKPDQQSVKALSITRAKAKMYEYDVPISEHITLYQDPAELFYLVIGIVGDLAATINRTNGQTPMDDETRKAIAFSARFLDSYLQSRLNQITDNYTKLLGAAAYYLSDNPGSSRVLASSIEIQGLELDAEGLENLLFWLLTGNLDHELHTNVTLQGLNIDQVANLCRAFFLKGESEQELYLVIDRLRVNAYGIDSPRVLLFADVISAVIRNKIKNSVWKTLPAYSGLSLELWRPTFMKTSFTKELWPAQHLLGEFGFFSGTSGVVQMPTSAGKTKATEMILRSAFLSNRASLTIVVAPFRALAHEIKNGLADAFEGEEIGVEEVSDVLMSDFDFEEVIPAPLSVLVITPEKLMHSLRHVPELFDRIDLLILDEGHQFDAGSRGITYELLVTDLKRRIKATTQIVLISAVIGNATLIGEWLGGANAKVVQGTNLAPTFRTIAFPTWTTAMGRLDFRVPADTSQHDFFVPRVLSRQVLITRKREDARYFPSADNHPNSVGLFLALKLISQGSVAIYCGVKATVGAICKHFRDINERGGEFMSPLEYSNSIEVRKLKDLYEANIGSHSPSTYCATFAIFTHHGNTPHGIRLAVEYAMQKSLAKFVICTSTLAQGVNLPLRYLIVTSVQQGQERMSTRDFNNLIGRAGRSGMHTEGSIIFADTRILDDEDSWRYNAAQDLLNPNKAEPCVSTLLSLFDPIRSAKTGFQIAISALEIVEICLKGVEHAYNWVDQIVTLYPKSKYDPVLLKSDFEKRLNLLSAVESYLLANWPEVIDEDFRIVLSRLAEGTLAYFLASENQKSELLAIFIRIAENIATQIPSTEEKRTFSKVLLGVMETRVIKEWASNNFDVMNFTSTDEQLLDVVWELITNRIKQKPFVNCTIPHEMRQVGQLWLHGTPFNTICEGLVGSGAKRKWGPKSTRPYDVDHVVEICELGFAFDAALALGAISELLGYLKGEEAAGLISRLNRLHKRLKYGLSEMTQVIIFEMGFADRVVCQELFLIIGEQSNPTRDSVRRVLVSNQATVESLLNTKFPSYYEYIWQRVLRES